MKSKELIKLLQECDPTGEVEVFVGGHDIAHVWSDPDYWDGLPWTHIRNDNGRIVGMRKGRLTGAKKVVIRTYDIEDLLLDNPEANVVIEHYNPQRQKQTEEFVEKLRHEGRELKKELDELMKKREAEKNSPNL